MPVASMAAARDTIIELFKNAMPVDLRVKYQGIDLPDTTEPAMDVAHEWVRFTLNHIDGGQQTLAGEKGRRRYNRVGAIVVQCYGPMTNRGFDRAEALAEAAVLAYQGKAGAGGIWFRDVRAQEIGPYGAWYQFNMVAEFTYDLFS